VKKIYYTLFIFCLFSGCASFHKNPPLTPANISKDGQTGYSFNDLLAQGNEIGDNLVIVSFSGGGTRAGALAYGVARHLETVKLPSEKSLLDEVKVISSVSGGSFASAYYGLYGKEKFLADYPKDVLYQDLRTQLVRNMLRVVRWLPIAFSTDMGRSDLSQIVYDNEIFHGHTFKDMPRKWPFIVINATDMTQGVPFSFIQENFNLLCSDLDEVKISRAVVSSSALPGAFTPLTFKNYPKSVCGYEMPAWAKEALQESPEKNLELYNWAKTLASYQDASKRPYVHAIDGGVSDNLGLMSLLYNFRTGGWDVLTPERKLKAKRFILIVVNAKPADSDALDLKARVPKLMQVMHSASTKPLNNYTVKTAQDFTNRFAENAAAAKNYEKFAGLCDQVYSGKEEREKCYSGFIAPYGGVMRPPYPEAYMIHVHFDALRDQVLREKVSRVTTDLQLKKSEVDSLIQAAKVILESSSEFQRLLKDLNAHRVES
jgi:NTE family protein